MIPIIFLPILLYRAGDVEKILDQNHIIKAIPPQPQFPVFQGNFSVVHYYVHSLLHKVDITGSEFSNFDEVSLTETWLNNSI